MCLAAADEWPLFRGDRAMTGVSHTALPDQPALRWTFKTGDAIKSSPVIAGGAVFVGSSDGHLYAVNLDTGKPRFKFKTEGPIESPPLVIDGIVYFGSWDNHFYALDAQTGVLKWKHLTGERVIGGANWVRVGGALQIIVGSYDSSLYCFDAKTGRVAWRYDTENYINGTPSVDDSRIVFGGCDEFLHILSHTGKPLAKINTGSYVAGSVALEGDRAWLGNMGNQFLCIDLKDEFIDWTFEQRQFPFYASPALGNDRVVFGGRDRRVHCLTRDDGDPIWEYATRGKVDASPVICGDRVIAASTDGRVYSLGLEDGKELWRYDIGADISASPAVATGMIIIAAEDGRVYAFADNDTNAKAKP